MLQGLMDHIVLQQRVTLDCVLLSLAGLLAHSVHRRYARTYRTYSFQRVSVRGICSTAVCIGFHSFVCTYMTVCLYVTFECSTENLQLEKLESIAGIMKWLQPFHNTLLHILYIMCILYYIL